MVTDLAEVFRLGAAKAEENVTFRRYLNAHHYPQKPFQILASEVQREVDCTACANCCRHAVVSVTKREIETIAAYLGANSEEITRLYTAPEPEAPALRTLLNSEDGCVFLDGNLCTIYEARPEACRNFPYIGGGSHSLWVRPSSLDRWAPLCPIIYNALESYKHLTGYHPHPRTGTTSGQLGRDIGKAAGASGNSCPPAAVSKGDLHSRPPAFQGPAEHQQHARGG